MNRREALRTLAASGAAGALAAGAVVAVTPAKAAEPVSLELAVAIELHRAALEAMELSGKVQGACERALRLLETPDTRSSFDAADDAFNLDCEREGEAHDRVIAAPIVTLADMRAKAAHLASVSRHIIHDNSTVAALLASMGGAPAKGSDLAPEPDPLAQLVSDYRQGLATYNASGDLTPDEDTALMEATWRPHYWRLQSPPVATTLAGALAAIRLVIDEEENCGSQPELTVAMLRAALAYFGGRA